MTTTAEDVNRVAKSILRDEKHEFDSEPALDDAMDIEELIPLVQNQLIDEKKTTADDNVCVENLLRRVLRKYRGKKLSIQEIDRDSFYWRHRGNEKDADFAGFPSCGKDVSQAILAERAVVGRAATTSNIVDTLVHELKKKEREFSKAEVKAVLGELKLMMANHLGEEGPGKFTIPGLCSIKVVDRTAAEPVEVTALADLKAMAKKNA